MTTTDVSESCGACGGTGTYLSPYDRHGEHPMSCLNCGGTGIFLKQLPRLSDEEIALHEIVRIASRTGKPGYGPMGTPAEGLARIEDIARALLLRLPEPPAARPLQMHERLAHDFVNETAGDAALRAFAPTSRTEQAQVDRSEATR